jgi:ADP-heptose:LPS heptosyltransferase
MRAGPTCPEPVEGHRGHVLLVRLDSMGDVLLTGGAVRAVAGSASRVTMMVAPAQEPVARLLPGVDDVIGFDAAWVPLEPAPLDRRAVYRAIRFLRRRRFAAALIFSSFHQSPLPAALMLRLAGVPWIGAICEDYPGSLLELRHRVPDDVPEAERNLSLATAAGFVPDERGARPAVRQTSTPPRWLPRRPYVVLHPGAAVPARRPSAEHSRAIVAALAAAGWAVVVTGGPTEAALTAEVCGAGGPDGAGVDAGGRLDLSGLVAVLAGAEAVVAPNTGPAHLAAAVGRPVVSLFAPVVPAVRWAPYGVPVITLGDQQAGCRDSRARVCPIPGHPCLSSITPEEVVAAVHALTGTSLTGTTLTGTTLTGTTLTGTGPPQINPPTHLRAGGRS